MTVFRQRPSGPPRRPSTSPTQGRAKPRVSADGMLTESWEGCELMSWARKQELAGADELRWLHHIPNGGARDPVTAANLKAEGVKPGVPDYELPVPAPRPEGGAYTGLHVELKRQDGGTTSDLQLDWHAALRRFGRAVVIADGHKAAATAIVDYLGGALELPAEGAAHYAWRAEW